IRIHPGGASRRQAGQEEKAGSQEETAEGRSRGVETNLPLPAHCGYLSRVVPDEYARARGCSSRDDGVTSEFLRRRTAAVGGGQSPRRSEEYTSELQS